MTRKPVLVQFSDDLIEQLDRIGDAQGRSRSAVVRDAVQRYIVQASDEIKDQLMAAAYERIPDDDEFDAWAQASVRELVNEESW